MNTDPGAWVLIYCYKTDKFLLGKRSNAVHKPGLWNFFGGHIGLDETPQTAMLRELEEETGLTPLAQHIHPLGEMGISEAGYANGLREFHYFLLFTDQELAPKRLGPEHTQSRWFAANSLPDDINRPTNVAIEIGMIQKIQLLAEELGMR